MQLDVSVNSASVLLGLRNGQKRLANATANSLNKTALRIQKAQKEHVARAFTLRGKRHFILREAAVIAFANVKADRYEAKVSVGEKPGLLLTTLERGGTRTSKSGQAVAVPLTGGARPTLKADIPAALHIRRLGLRRSRGRKQSGLLVRHLETLGGGLKGKLGTFTVSGIGIFQRVGNLVRALYIYKPSVPVPRKLDFIKNAHRVAQRWFRQELSVAVREALNFNRNR